jgi:hypothetical protein
MKEALELALAICLAFLVLGAVRLLSLANKRLLAGGPILGGRIRPRGSNRFPLVPINDLERERSRPAIWAWTLVDLIVMLVILVWLLRLHR